MGGYAASERECVWSLTALLHTFSRLAGKLHRPMTADPRTALAELYATDIGPFAVQQQVGEALRELVVAEGAERTLEIGLAWGASTLYICDGLRTTGGSHVTIDPLQEDEWGNAGLAALERAGVRKMVEFHDRDSQLVLPRMVEEGRRFDLAFIDGDHRFDGVFVDAYFVNRLVRPGGIVALDDSWLEPTMLTAGFLVSNLGYELVSSDDPVYFHWRRSKRALGRRRPFGQLVVLRAPESQPKRSWEHFAGFRLE